MEPEPTLPRLRARCPDAWAAFYRAHVDSVWRFAYRKLGGRDAADEATSDTFLAAVEAIDRYDPGKGTLGGWLFGIARRKVADRFRAMRQARLRLVDHRVDELPARWAGDDRRREIRERVAAVLASARSIDRDVLLGAYRDGLAVARLAERLNRTPKAVENLLYRARQRFKAAYRAALDAEHTGDDDHEQRRLAPLDR